MLLPADKLPGIIICMREQTRIAGPVEHRRGIQSVETGLRLLAELAAANDPVTLSSLSARSGLSPSQTHRYLQSLVASGMAVQQESLRYDLGPGVMRIGIAALSRLDAFGAAELRIREFVDATGRTASLAVWSESGPVLVRWFPGRPPLLINLPVGSPLPLFASATGQIFLGLLGDAELEAPLPVARAQGFVIPDLASLRAAVRATLSAEAVPPQLAGLRSVAAPIFDLQGRVQLVAASVSSSIVPGARDLEIDRRLRQACRAATETIGGAWPIEG